MTPAARLAAAIEIIDIIGRNRIPAASAMRDWGTAHRFAGSGDRAAIAGLVYDVLRRNASSAFLMGDDRPRARLLGMLRLERSLDADAIAALCDGSRFAPAPLSDVERAALISGTLQGAPPHVAGDYPEWLDADLARVFGDERAQEMAATASRAPLDLRVNTLKADREAMHKSLAHLGATPTPWSPMGLRIELGADARNPGIHAETDFIKGHVEVQDEGSQLAALLAAPQPGMQVIDLCAGAGGKTLALAALMQGKGRIVATDADKRQLAPIHERLARAGAHNVEVRAPKGAADPLADLRGAADLVVVDAPCTGTGTWRRNPDAKWRMRPGALDLRIKDQATVLDRAAALVRPGGRIVYITCSVLDAENSAQVAAFVARRPAFAVLPSADIVAPLRDRAAAFLAAARATPQGLLTTPHRTGTDGFFVAILQHGAR